jgi:hypothetical protein
MEMLQMLMPRSLAVLSLLGIAACAGAAVQGSAPASATAAPVGMPASHMMSMPGAGAPAPRSYSKEIQAGYDIVRKATASFTNLDSLVAHGYRRDVPQCFADSIYGSGGAMGFHHVNATYFNDGKLEIDKPEIVMFQRHPDGKYEMTGVEYILPYKFWPKDSAVAPKLMGKELMHENDRNYWYFHMWIWKPSSTGLFADWNPSVKCPPK